MCTTCGCGEERHHDHDHEHGHGHDHDHHHHHETRTVKIERDLLAKNDALAAETRRMLDARAIAVINLIGSPGAGKTTLLETTIERMRGIVDLSVLEGDQATE